MSKEGWFASIALVLVSTLAGFLGSVGDWIPFWWLSGVGAGAALTVVMGELLYFNRFPSR